ncbi:MAG: cytochrome c [Acidobacteria bacterium]|nr:cytochrome c [Acidobacteriota bacterium]
MNRWLLAGAAVAVLLIGIWLAVGRNAQIEMNLGSDPIMAANTGEKETEVAAIPDPIKRGEQVFDNNCSVCHSSDTDEVIIGPSLKGFFSGTPAPLADSEKPLPQTDAAVRRMIQEGNSYMPPLGSDLTEQQITDVIAYLHTL